MTTLEDFGPAVAASACMALDRCLGPIAEIFLGGSDCATAFARDFEASELDALRAAVDAGRVEYDPTRVDACLSAIDSAGCDALSGLPTVCEDALRGTVAVGGDCGIDAECAGDAFCTRTGTTCPGRCTGRAGSGGACTDDEECTSGLVCTRDACGAPAAPGAACEGAMNPSCGGGYLCVGSDGGMSGTCRSVAEVTSAGVGDSCDFEAGVLCQSGLSCAVVSLGAGGAVTECMAEVGAGAACNVGFPDMCPDGQYCDADIMMGMFAGTCRPLPSEGQECLMGFFPPVCAGGHVCLGGTCRLSQLNGGTCVEDAHCYSDNCASGTCASPPSCF